jgi:predicted metal-dependent hydrolase
MRSATLHIIAAAAIALFAAVPSWSDTPGKHPAYLHALSDLRDARAHLQHFSSEPVVMEEEHAIDHIDKAIAEIKRAAIMDGKDIQDHVPVDAHLARHDRFRKAMELLDKAQRDVSGEEDQPDTQGLQQRVIRHIEEARRSVRHAIETMAQS